MSDDLPPMTGIDPAGATPDMTAAELAFGLLDGDERAAALRRLLSDRTFAAEVERWREHIAQLFDLWPEASAPPELFGRVERSLDPQTEPVAAPAQRLAQRGWLWPSAAGVASIAAAALLFVVVNRPAPLALAPRPAPVAQAPVPAAMLVAAIAPTEKGAPVTAIYDPASGGMRLTAASLAGAGRSQELWLIAGDGVPHSLGLLRSAGTALAVSADNRARLAAGAVLAVSLEPVGGSPTGLPTGPVVAKGSLSQV